MALIAATADLWPQPEYLDLSALAWPGLAATPTNAIAAHDFPALEAVLPQPVVASPIGGQGGGTAPEVVVPQYIRGHVLDADGYGVPRLVIAVDRATGQRMAITTSGADGDFTIRPRTLEPCILIAVPLDGEQLNAVVLDNILPVPD